MNETLKEQLLEQRLIARNKLAHLEKCVQGFTASIAEARKQLEDLNEALAKLSEAKPSKPPLPNNNPWKNA